ncbi:hypothetical protein HDU93_006284 [Gonapodya sp. JEL0774]|nr:hypothetical protein HDU93_006284 [Gonapodya sp. JEL0774]
MSPDNGRSVSSIFSSPAFRTLLLVVAILGSGWFFFTQLAPPSPSHPHFPSDHPGHHPGPGSNFAGLPQSPESGGTDCPPAKTVTVTVTVKAKPPDCTPAPAAAPQAAAPTAPKLDDGGRKAAFDYVYDKTLWGSGESLSGPGSYFTYTANARRFISAVLRTFNLKKILDSPCGDCHWQWAIPEIHSGAVEYTGVDIVESVILRDTTKHIAFPNIRFAAMDMVSRDDVFKPKAVAGSKEPKPLWEVINCRDAIQHINIKDGVKAVKNFEASGAKYLVTGWYSGGVPNQDVVGQINPGNFYSVDPMLPPFNFPRPLFWTLDGWNYDLDGKGKKNMKMIGVWKLPALGLGNGTTIPLDVDKLWEWWEDPKKVHIVEGDGMARAEWVDDPGYEIINSIAG